jgi:hemerythrin-like domain-containing protein
MSTTEVLHNHHKHCDELFADAEAAGLHGDWGASAASFTRLRDELEAHFATEEQVLFPAFEAATGMSGGPTQMMRFEHAQMRELIEQMQAALDRRGRDAFAGAAETLLVLMQQHNMKEENILYPMCDRTLEATVDVAAGLRERLEEACPASV